MDDQIAIPYSTTGHTYFGHPGVTKMRAEETSFGGRKYGKTLSKRFKIGQPALHTTG